MRRVSILGATGSIGQNTLDLIRRRRGEFRVVGLTGGQNIAQLAGDAREFGAEVAVTSEPSLLKDLRDALSGSGIRAAAGPEALVETASQPADWVMSAIVGAAGIAPSLAVARQGATLALANKETLVAAGALLMEEAGAADARVLPVDSEHSAVFQALVGESPDAVERVVITASGGPFRDWTKEQLAEATLDQALRHPNWSMGQRITIDSASMFNKALEIIETREFFGFAPDQIEVVVHPESLVHALVAFQDGALMAHIGPADMRHAIGFALNWPKRRDLPVERLDLARIGQLRFEAPDPDRFPALRLAREVMATGGHAGAVFNAAKEAALDAFMARRIGFLDMGHVVEAVLDTMQGRENLAAPLSDLDTVLNYDQIARINAGEVIERIGQNTRVGA